MKKGLYKIAIIGAGISGMNCAYQLSKFADVTVFEKLPINFKYFIKIIRNWEQYVLL